MAFRTNSFGFWIWFCPVFLIAVLAVGPNAVRQMTDRPRSYEKVLAEQLRRTWQAQHCPPEALKNLDEIALPDGSIADVEILDLPGGRIYLPRPWTTYTRHFHGPSPDGVSADTSGGTFEPRLGPGAEGVCRGIVYTSTPGKRDAKRRFGLRLGFRPRTDRGDFVEGPTGLAFPNMEFAFFGPETINQNLWYGPELPPAAQRNEDFPLIDGWRIFDRDNTREYNDHVIYDARAEAQGPAFARAFEGYTDWGLDFPISANVRVKIFEKEISSVPHWREHGDVAKDVLDWLRTRPADRKPLPGGR